MPVVNIVGGGLLLAFGRRIFWLFVALVGFFAGFEFTTTYLKVSPEWVVFAIAIVIGLLGAVLAYFLKKVAIGVAGFLVGIYLGSSLLGETVLQGPGQGLELAIIIVAGVLGAVLMVLVFDWALIILSSLVGASLVVNGFGLVDTAALIVTVVLVVAGVLIQTRIGLPKATPRETSNQGT